MAQMLIAEFLLYRPLGADSIWALHAGFTGGAGYLRIPHPDDDVTRVVGLVTSLALGVSVGP